MLGSANSRFTQQNPGVKTANFAKEFETYRQNLDAIDRLAASLAQT
jgi:hypothetical protein